jgi:hypothetical protein
MKCQGDPLCSQPRRRLKKRGWQAERTPTPKCTQLMLTSRRSVGSTMKDLRPRTQAAEAPPRSQPHSPPGATLLPPEPGPPLLGAFDVKEPPLPPLPLPKAAAEPGPPSPRSWRSAIKASLMPDSVMRNLAVMGGGGAANGSGPSWQGGLQRPAVAGTGDYWARAPAAILCMACRQPPAALSAPLCRSPAEALAPRPLGSPATTKPRGPRSAQA